MRHRIPTIVPSRFSPISTYCTWPRPWPIATMFSERVSTHLTGRPSSIADLAATTPSDEMCFAPNEPPTLGAITRRRSASMPSEPASTPRIMCGIWHARCTTRSKSPSSGTTAIALPSIGTTATRWFSKRPRTTTSAPSSASSRPVCMPMTMFEPIASNCSGASDASAASMSTAASQRVVVDDRRAPRRRPLARASRRRHRDRIADEVHAGPPRVRCAAVSGCSSMNAAAVGNSRSSAV